MQERKVTLQIFDSFSDAGEANLKANRELKYRFLREQLDYRFRTIPSNNSQTLKLRNNR